jgi:hypothetical protein
MRPATTETFLPEVLSNSASIGPLAANERSDFGAIACPMLIMPISYFRSSPQRAISILLFRARFPVNAATTPERLEYFQIEAILNCCLKAF